MTEPVLLIVEPWYTAVGHPAQSLLNTAKVLGRRQDVHYLVSSEDDSAEKFAALPALSAYGVVHAFRVPRPSLAVGTARAVIWLIRHARRWPRLRQVFFLDADLTVLAAAWPLLRFFLPQLHLVSVLELGGPERRMRGFWRPAMIRRLVGSSTFRLFLRTEELADAWRKSVGIPHALQIGTLPSLEIADEEVPDCQPGAAGSLRVGVLGQVRPGKGIDWLVPLFQGNPDLGLLEIAGTFFNDAQRAQLPGLQGFAGFHDSFMSDDELLQRAGALDYLLTLYDQWDSRFEAATFYLAARAGRPVVCYDEGWCGRMVRQFGCGLAVPRAVRPDTGFFRALPRRDSAEYCSLVEGMRRFRKAHTGDARRSEFLEKLAGRTAA